MLLFVPKPVYDGVLITWFFKGGGATVLFANLSSTVKILATDTRTHMFKNGNFIGPRNLLLQILPSASDASNSYVFFSRLKEPGLYTDP